MSGFEGLAAIFGVADVTLRAVLELYNFLSAIKDVPRELERIRREIELFFECLRPLKTRLTTIDTRDKASLLSEGLRQAVRICSQACASLKADLTRWCPAEKATLRVRLTFQLNKKKIESATAEFVTSKQAVILAIVAESLSLQLKKENAMPAQKAPNTQTSTGAEASTSPVEKKPSKLTLSPGAINYGIENLTRDLPAPAPPRNEASRGAADPAGSSDDGGSRTQSEISHVRDFSYENVQEYNIGRPTSSLAAGGRQVLEKMTFVGGRGCTIGIFEDRK